ncbi:MAG: alanine racemase, partial [Clostridia bacterium]|nr:alanine racemase [Clostridia bacterium]
MGARLVVEKDALIRNYLKLRDMCGVEVIPVLKSNAYGLGLLQAAGIFSELGAKRIAVSRVGEAEALSNLGTESEIILLSSSDSKSDIERGVRSGATLAAGSLLSLQLINDVADRAERKAKVHLLIDTGFSHSGLRDFEYEKAANMLPALRYVTVTGIFTQFTESHAKRQLFTELQNERFENAAKFFSKRIGRKLLVHAANSCAAVRYPETRYDAVRIGSGLLGRLPAG